MGFNWFSFLRYTLVVFFIAATATAFITLPVEKILKDFLIWVEKDLGRWGPLALVVAYIPLTILAVPAAVLTLGGGYLFGLPVGFLADSVGATAGAAAAYLLGRTIARSFVISKVKDYPQFQAVAIAVQKSGFKIILLLRLVPILPFSMLNYLLSMTPTSMAEYILATWLGMLPITLVLVYAGTTLKDLSDVTHGWHEFSKSRWALIVLSLLVSVVLIFWVTKVAKSALERALVENEDIHNFSTFIDTPVDLQQPLVANI
ncbi:SNARE associated Golgi protein family [Heracleum sosnowskyi]|uniref:SNARE associated Golgi protein family n=1 Tax=Heracleum sosnowskyi TaxID=360622 RepID=A0AAD8J2M7_9APIA|nr:SNARE associated Golgi protein family [Heracleum sosnowskyi]